MKDSCTIWRLLSSLALLALASCSMSDLRTPLLLDHGLTPAGSIRGRKMLEQALSLHGGKRWADQGSAIVVLRDEWQGFLGWLFRPWPGNPTRVRMRYELGRDRPSCQFLSGDHAGEEWGIDKGQSFVRRPDGTLSHVDMPKLRFILRAYQYFFEFPAKSLSAPIIAYAGERQLGQQSFDLVFLTWGKAEPHAEHDQYLVWLDKRTRRIEAIQYTIREKFDFATGFNRYSDFREVEGLLIPFRYTIAQNPAEGSFVHQVVIESVEFERPDSR